MVSHEQPGVFLHFQLLNLPHEGFPVHEVSHEQPGVLLHFQLLKLVHEGEPEHVPDDHEPVQVHPRFLHFHFCVILLQDTVPLHS